MNLKEFIRRLDRLYDAKDALDEKLKLRANLPCEAISECAQHFLGIEVSKLIREYFSNRED